MSKILPAIMLEDLARSGLTTKDATMAGFKYLSAKETQELGFQPLPAMYIPYWDPIEPKNPQSVLPKWPPFFRVRYLAEPNGFNKITGGKTPRYMQPAGSGVCAYWSRGTDWEAIIADPTRPIIITEGEKKALKTCLAGHPTIGLGGVWNFRSSREPLWALLLPDLVKVNWAKRQVYIIYDSDSSTNPQVCAALWELADELARYHGALPHMVKLHNVYDDETKKTGLDDYLTAGQDLGALLEEAEPLTLARPLWDLNRRVIYVRDPGLIVERRTMARISPRAFKEHAYSAENYVERRLLPDGTITLAPVNNIASVWLSWSLRAEALRMTYRPGEGTELHDGYNVWSGWKVQPKQGDVKLFTQLIDHLFTGTPEEEKVWFLRWLAYPLQFPGTKLFTAAVIFGLAQGTGKSLVGYTLGEIYGQNFSEINQDHLVSSFNEWAVCKQFVLADDITGSDKRAHADLLKKLITQKELRVNQKFIPSYVVPDCINYFFTSNQPDAFFLEDNDRRYFVHEIMAGPLPDSFYRAYDTWYKSGEGAAAVFHYLLHYDLGDFNPSAPALRTQAKFLMTLDTKSDAGSWVFRLKEHPDELLKVGEIVVEKDLYTAAELLLMYDPMQQHKIKVNGFSREMKRAGFLQVLRGQSVTTSQGTHRYYILRNSERWIKATLAEIKTHLDLAAQPDKPKKKKY